MRVTPRPVAVESRQDVPVESQPDGSGCGAALVAGGIGGTLRCGAGALPGLMRGWGPSSMIVGPCMMPGCMGLGKMPPGGTLPLDEFGKSSALGPCVLRTLPSTQSIFRASSAKTRSPSALLRTMCGVMMMSNSAFVLYCVR